MKSAIVIGATGLVGKNLTRQLLKNLRYEQVTVFARHTMDIAHPNLKEEIVNFDFIDDWKNRIRGDELYSALGTTIKKAGSKEAQYKIDYTYQYQVAKAASENGVKNYFLISSTGANYKSKNFYLRIKGELENKILDLPFKKIRIFQPSILLGQRNEKRIAEKLGIAAAKVFTVLPFLKKYKPIEAKTLAQAIINSANNSNEQKLITYKLLEIFELANHGNKKKL